MTSNPAGWNLRFVLFEEGVDNTLQRSSNGYRQRQYFYQQLNVSMLNRQTRSLWTCVLLTVSLCVNFENWWRLMTPHSCFRTWR